MMHASQGLLVYPSKILVLLKGGFYSVFFAFYKSSSCSIDQRNFLSFVLRQKKETKKKSSTAEDTTPPCTRLN
jgi:hypothetical protein